MNTDRARAYGLVFKLTYVFLKPDQPSLEVFLDNELTRAEQWEIYGVSVQPEQSGKPQELFRKLKFEELGQSKQFELGGNFQIEFVGIGEEEVDYRRIGKRIEPAYHFRVVEMCSDDW